LTIGKRVARKNDCEALVKANVLARIHWHSHAVGLRMVATGHGTGH